MLDEKEREVAEVQQVSKKKTGPLLGGAIDHELLLPTCTW